MTEKRPFADFARFAFIEDDASTPVEPLARLNAETNTDQESKRFKLHIPVIPAKPAAVVKTPVDHAGLQELYRSDGFVERPLRLLMIGINPSDQSWTKGHYYANPSNRMWFLLGKAGIVPSGFTADCDRRCPSELGLGFTDLLSGIAETQSCNITDATLRSYKTSFFQRLEAHVQRASTASGVRLEESYPKIIAFAGVRQWKSLFPNGYFDGTSAGKRKEKTTNKNQPLLTNMFSSLNAEPDETSNALSAVKSETFEVSATIPAATASSSSNASSTSTSTRTQSTIPYGLQTERPPGWPPALQHSKVFLLPSSSGAAAMSNTEREEPYMELGQLLASQEEYQWISGAGLASQTHIAFDTVHAEGLVEPCADEKCNSSNSIPCEFIDLTNSP